MCSTVLRVHFRWIIYYFMQFYQKCTSVCVCVCPFERERENVCVWCVCVCVCVHLREKEKKSVCVPVKERKQESNWLATGLLTSCQLHKITSGARERDTFWKILCRVSLFSLLISVARIDSRTSLAVSACILSSSWYQI